MTVNLQAQADAVERAATNLAGHVRTLGELVERRKRPQHDLEIAAAWLPALQAAAATMRRVATESTVKGVTA